MGSRMRIVIQALNLEGGDHAASGSSNIPPRNGSFQVLDARTRQRMNNQTPMAVWRAGMDKIEAARRGLWLCRFAWTTQTRCPHTHSRSRSSKKRLDS